MNLSPFSLPLSILISLSLSHHHHPLPHPTLSLFNVSDKHNALSYYMTVNENQP